MTLTELDTLINATPAAGAIITSYVDWFALFDPLPEGAIMEWDGLEYRDLPVWVAMPGETRVLSAAEAYAAGIGWGAAREQPLLADGNSRPG